MGGGVYNYCICQVTKNDFISGSDVYSHQASVNLSPLMISVRINILDVSCTLVTSNYLICSHTKQSNIRRTTRKVIES